MVRCSQEFLQIPNKEEFHAKLFSQADNRMYMVARNLVDSSWGNPSSMADGVGVLLYIWNRAFYQDGSTLDFDELEDCIDRNLQVLQSFRNKSILKLSEPDAEIINKLFNDFMNALAGVKETEEGERKIKKGPVGVAKTLHLLAPEFFPMWDTQIAIDYRCRYSTENAAERYIRFCKWIKQFAESVNKKCRPLPNDRTLVKLIDEYNHKTRSTKEEKHYKVLRKAS